jgi:hypothetical protein
MIAKQLVRVSRLWRSLVQMAHSHHLKSRHPPNESRPGCPALTPLLVARPVANHLLDFVCAFASVEGVEDLWMP